ncbi:GntR family transcriptional regulator [Nitratireductor alexandrii]|uniref:GntR family transcriptional regulator n=1 Tax=Nitratireductor alexandrii TaxID=2448161 RepID=UPI000FDCDD3A|nr:GntR family transcriptional regulator [Nitratireductor alexandrii]
MANVTHPQAGAKRATSASDPIYADIKARILSGRLPPATPLRQDEIARSHGVSKIPVREALRRLEVENLVVFEKNKGATVRFYTETEILQLLDIRIALECRALELAVPNMIAADFRETQALLRDYAQKVEVSEWSRLNVQFHQMLYEPCGNRQLLAMIDDLQQKLGQYLRLLVTEATGLERPMREHQDILSACMAGDVDAAVAALRAHIEATKKEVAAFLRRGA